MLIEWAENPLATEVTLDGHDVEILRLKIIIDDLEHRVVAGLVDVEDGRYDEARKSLAIDWMDAGPEQEARDKMLADRLRYAREALSEGHAGDCICLPSSCMKCWTEMLLGIDTIPDLERHAGHAIANAFRAVRTMTTLEACAWLEANPAKAQGFVASPELEATWRASQVDAIKWLRAYEERKRAEMGRRP